MTGDGGVVGEDAVVAYDAVVSDVRVSEKVVVAADCGWRVGRCRAVDGAALAEGIAITYFEKCWLGFVFQILGALADGGEREERVVVANAGRAFDDDVRLKLAAVAEGDVVSNHAIRAHDDVFAEYCRF